MITVLAVFSSIALAWPDEIVVVSPANAVVDVVPKASTVLAVFAVIALAWLEVMPVLAVFAAISD